MNEEKLLKMLKHLASVCVNDGRTKHLYVEHEVDHLYVEDDKLIITFADGSKFRVHVTKDES